MDDDNAKKIMAYARAISEYCKNKEPESCVGCPFDVKNNPYRTCMFEDSDGYGQPYGWFD